MTEPLTPTSSFYPVSLDVAGLPCLVVGGGAVAARKAHGLASCGAVVTVIARSLGPEMEDLLPSLHTVFRRPYQPGDAASFRLVLTATGRDDVDGEVFADADAAGVWVNSADDRVHSSFILPAVYRDGSVTVAVSTGGTSPALASWLRDRLGASCGGDLGTVAELIGEARQRLLQAGLPSNAVDWAGLLDGPLIAFVRAGDLDNARAILTAAAIN